MESQRALYAADDRVERDDEHVDDAKQKHELVAGILNELWL